MHLQHSWMQLPYDPFIETRAMMHVDSIPLDSVRAGRPEPPRRDKFSPTAFAETQRHIRQSTVVPWSFVGNAPESFDIDSNWHYAYFGGSVLQSPHDSV
jgi:hypothetical protein